MKDRYFFPLAGLVIAGIVGFAVTAGDPDVVRSEADIIAKGYEISGADLAGLTAAPGLTYSIMEGSEGIYVVMAAHISQNTPPPSAGIFAALSREYEQAFAERKLRISIEARAGQTDPSPLFKSSYFTVDSGASGWKSFTPTENFETYSYEYRPGPVGSELGVDHLGIFPDVTGANRSIEVRSIRVDVIE